MGLVHVHVCSMYLVLVLQLVVSFEIGPCGCETDQLINNFDFTGVVLLPEKGCVTCSNFVCHCVSCFKEFLLPRFPVRAM